MGMLQNKVFSSSKSSSIKRVGSTPTPSSSLPHENYMIIIMKLIFSYCDAGGTGRSHENEIKLIQIVKDILRDVLKYNYVILRFVLTSSCV